MKHIVALFPGQGSQKIGMGKDFYENSSLAKERIEEASDRLGVDFRKILFEPNDLLDQTQFTQPAILLTSLVAYELFIKELDIQPQAVLGHSLGEFSALSSVGALETIDGVELVHHRGRLMQEAAKSADGGMMVVLGLGDEEIEQICAEARSQGKRVWPANYNSEGQIVVAGLKSDLSSMEPIFKERGAKRAMLLNMSVASHCPLMEGAVEPLRELVDRFVKDSFKAPVISNVTAKPYKSKSEALDLLPQQLVKPVLYKQSIEGLQPDMFIEFGEGAVLKGLNRRITKVPTLNVKDMRSLETALKEIV